MKESNSFNPVVLKVGMLTGIGGGFMEAAESSTDEVVDDGTE